MQVRTDFVGAALFGGVALSTTGLEETSTFLSVTYNTEKRRFMSVQEVKAAGAPPPSRHNERARKALVKQTRHTVRHIYNLFVKKKKGKYKTKRVNQHKEMCSTKWR